MTTECEHHFSVVTQQWEYQQRSFTLRFCEHCGLTHRLVWYERPSKWIWEHIPEEEQPYYREKDQMDDI